METFDNNVKKEVEGNQSDNIESNRQKLKKDKGIKKNWIIVLSQVVVLLGILAVVYFLWYVPSRERERWERQQAEKAFGMVEEQKQLLQEQEDQQRAEAERIERQRQEYLSTTRGQLESQGYQFMGDVEGYEGWSDTNEVDWNSKKFELYSISNGSTTRWVAVRKSDSGLSDITYNVTRGSYSKKICYDDRYTTFNAKAVSGSSVYYLKI